jgi:hypothetical protein
MKKTFGVILITVLALSLATPAFAKHHKHKKHHHHHSAQLAR